MSVPIRSVPAASAPSRIPHYIAGQRVAGDGARTSAVFDPASGAQTGELPLASPAEVDAAVQAARAAFPAWAATPPARRAKVLFKLRELLEALNVMCNLYPPTTAARELLAKAAAQEGASHG